MNFITLIWGLWYYILVLISHVFLHCMFVTGLLHLDKSAYKYVYSNLNRRFIFPYVRTSNLLFTLHSSFVLFLHMSFHSIPLSLSIPIFHSYIFIFFFLFNFCLILFYFYCSSLKWLLYLFSVKYGQFHALFFLVFLKMKTNFCISQL